MKAKMTLRAKKCWTGSKSKIIEPRFPFQDTSLTLEEAVERTKQHLNLPHLRLAVGREKSMGNSWHSWPVVNVVKLSPWTKSKDNNTAVTKVVKLVLKEFFFRRTFYIWTFFMAPLDFWGNLRKIYISTHQICWQNGWQAKNRKVPFLTEVKPL